MQILHIFEAKITGKKLNCTQYQKKLLSKSDYKPSAQAWTKHNHTQSQNNTRSLYELMCKLTMLSITSKNLIQNSKIN